jgi:alpha-galactosidase
MSKKSTSEKVVEARRVREDIAASELNHPAWETAEVVKITRYWSGEEAPRERHAVACLIWSAAALCVRFICRQAEPLVVSAEPQVSRKTIGLWDRDVCELFIAPDASEPRHYFEFEAAPTGEWLDLAIHQGEEERQTDWEFRSGMTVAARVLPDQITIAMRVPWEALGHIPRTGELWRANLTRCVGAGERRGYLAWQPTYTEQPNFHAPEVFGQIIFK